MAFSKRVKAKQTDDTGGWEKWKTFSTKMLKPVTGKHDVFFVFKGFFPKLTESPRYDMKDGTVYGRGQWATSLKYHRGKFYALFAPNDNPGGDTYICTADSAEGKWTIHSRLRHFHDAPLFFDDDDKAYVAFGTGNMVQLNADLTDRFAIYNYATKNIGGYVDVDSFEYQK